MVPIDCIGGALDARTRSWFRDELIEDIVIRDDVAGNDPAVAIASEGGAPSTQLQRAATHDRPTPRREMVTATQRHYATNAANGLDCGIQ
jgi:hypothetical protein